MPCQVCGKYSGYYPLCKECNESKEKGKVLKCESCGIWFKGKASMCSSCTDKEKESKKGNILLIYKNVLEKAWEDGIITEDEKELLTALRKNLGISYEEHQQLEAPIKREVKSLSRVMNKIQDTKNELENDFRKRFPPEYRADDGHLVRSKDERYIDNWLYKNKIAHSSEDKLTGANIYCDFFLPYKGGIYVEYWGMVEKDDYAKRMKQKIEFYDKKKFTRIDIYPKDMKDPATQLPEIFRQYLPKGLVD